MQAVWEMMSDSKIWALLGDIDRPIDEDITRFMLVELFSRVKRLEEENLSLRVLLMEENLVDDKMYEVVVSIVRDFLEHKDREKTAESDFFASSGISFPEWVSFKLTGQFDKPQTGSSLF